MAKDKAINRTRPGENPDRTSREFKITVNNIKSCYRLNVCIPPKIHMLKP